MGENAVIAPLPITRESKKVIPERGGGHIFLAVGTFRGEVRLFRSTVREECERTERGKRFLYVWVVRVLERHKKKKRPFPTNRIIFFLLVCGGDTDHQKKGH